MTEKKSTETIIKTRDIYRPVKNLSYVTLDIIILKSGSKKKIEYSTIQNYDLKVSRRIVRLRQDFDPDKSYQIIEMIFKNGNLVKVEAYKKVLWKTPNGFLGTRHMKITNVSRFVILDTAIFSVMKLRGRGYNIKTQKYKGFIL